MNATTITLTGFLGKDREIRETRERTYTRREPATRLEFHCGGALRYEDVLPNRGDHEVTVPSRQYALLSLATHRWQGSEQTTTWHRIVAWNLDRLERMPVRLCRKGDRVRITGRPTSFTTADGRTIEQIELESLQILRSRAPEVP